MKSPITTHVLDTANGKPAENIHVILEMKNDQDSWKFLGDGTTDSDGRINDFSVQLESSIPGIFRLSFNVARYFQTTGTKSFYATIPIEFSLDDPDSHYHVPLLLNPYGYSTYRGS